MNSGGAPCPACRERGGGSRTLEFKTRYGQPKGRSRSFNEEQKRELLADMSSFANTGGGDLLIGITEEVVGLDLAGPDKEKLKLESMSEMQA
ncbi:AlbA family DNA-binding domain-containing protein [Mesorhizobium sp. f-mel]